LYVVHLRGGPASLALQSGGHHEAQMSKASEASVRWLVSTRSMATTVPCIRHNLISAPASRVDTSVSLAASVISCPVTQVSRTSGSCLTMGSGSDRDRLLERLDALAAGSSALTQLTGEDDELVLSDLRGIKCVEAQVVK